MGKHQAFPMTIRGNEKALEQDAWCLVSFIFERDDSPYRLVPYR